MPIFSSLEIYDDEQPRSATVNMALDEVFWQSASTPRIRFYEWDHPALSFGYFGRYREIAHYRSERELVRRCTGGGVVFHGNDLTYALVIPANELVPGTSAVAIYALVHQAIQTALRDSGIGATLAAVTDGERFAHLNALVAPKPNGGHVAQTAAATARPTSPDSCFANPVHYDVLVKGRKVAGAAQRRSRRGLLHQGSIQDVDLRSDFRSRFTEGLASKTVAQEIDSALLEQAHALAAAKYQTDTWLQRR